MFSYCPMWMGQYDFWQSQVRGEGGNCDIFSTTMYYPENALSRSISLIKDAVNGEREDEMFYDYLISVAPSQKDKMIIAGIRDDERKHNKMFRQLYCELTGVKLSPAQEDVDFTPPRNYLDGIEKALFGELGAVERYRQILFGLTERHQINMVTEITTDELKHASKYNFLFTENTRDHNYQTKLQTK
ncbi:MAG: ferritin-like domain-containing protein [Dehalobacterium sp.]